MQESSSDFPAGVRKPISRAPSLKGPGGCGGGLSMQALQVQGTRGPRWQALLVEASNLELSAVSHGMPGCPRRAARVGELLNDTCFLLPYIGAGPRTFLEGGTWNPFKKNRWSRIFYIPEIFDVLSTSVLLFTSFAHSIT